MVWKDDGRNMVVINEGGSFFKFDKGHLHNKHWQSDATGRAAGPMVDVPIVKEGVDIPIEKKVVDGPKAA